MEIATGSLTFQEEITCSNISLCAAVILMSPMVSTLNLVSVINSLDLMAFLNAIRKTNATGMVRITRCFPPVQFDSELRTLIYG